MGTPTQLECGGQSPGTERSDRALDAYTESARVFDCLTTHEHTVQGESPRPGGQRVQESLPAADKGQERSFFPIARVENLIFHGVLGKIFGIVLPQEWGKIALADCCSIFLTELKSRT